MPTDTLAAADATFAAGVKMAVYWLVLTVVNADSAPWPTATSPKPKPVTASLKRKVMSAVCPDPTRVLSLVMLRVGARVSMACVTLAMAAFTLPAASRAAPWPTATCRLSCRLASAVMAKLYWLALMAVNVPGVPPVIPTSLATKPVTGSLKVKV